MEFNFYMPTKIHFGQNKIKKVGKIVKPYGKKAFIVTGKTSARKLGFLKTLEEALKEEKIDAIFFEKVEPNPSVETVEKGAYSFKKEKCDFIVALGGGSPIDAAKAIGILVSNSLPLTQYFGKDKVEKSIPPLIAIPTTAGTGSEVTPYAVITESHTKKIITSSKIFPKEAILDPVLTFSLSSTLTSDTGIDALSHAIESYVSKKASPLSETVALQAVKLIGEYLPKVIESPCDIEARSQMMYASLLAGIAISQTGTTLLHSMGYRLTSDFNVPHGRANGILLPSFWEINFSGCPEKFSTLILSLNRGVNKEKTKDAKKSSLLVKDFLCRVGLSEKITLDIKEENFVQFAKEVIENKRKLKNNPKELNLEDIVKIYKKALS